MKSIITIEGMTCKHCVAHVTALVNDFLSESKFIVNLGKNTVEFNDVDDETIQKIKTAINEDGIYKAI